MSNLAASEHTVGAIIVFMNTVACSCFLFFGRRLLRAKCAVKDKFCSRKVGANEQKNEIGDAW